MQNGSVDLLLYQESLCAPHCAAKHLVTNFRLLQDMPLKCHSRSVKYSVLDSKNLHNLEPPYGIEP